MSFEFDLFELFNWIPISIGMEYNQGLMLFKKHHQLNVLGCRQAPPAFPLILIYVILLLAIRVKFMP
jgi:hypothetical protein